MNSSQVITSILLAGDVIIPSQRCSRMTETPIRARLGVWDNIREERLRAVSAKRTGAQIRE
jgi:hypothetical protein